MRVCTRSQPASGHSLRIFLFYAIYIQILEKEKNMIEYMLYVCAYTWTVTKYEKDL